MARISPYAGVAELEWSDVTRRLIADHPLDTDELVAVVLRCWEGIFETKIAGRLHIGKDIFPSPQILGSFLHELIPVELEALHPGVWRREVTAAEKDLVYVPDDRFSVEIKASSQAHIYGNRSFAQKSQARAGKKDKSGYYLAVNFPPVHKLKRVAPVTMIRFGWLDIEDWQGQAAASGQQASLSKAVREGKLLTLHPVL